MRMKTDSNLEILFKHKLQQIVVEYELTYDFEEYYTDITRIEVVDGLGLSAEDFAVAQAQVDRDAELRWAEHREASIAYLRD